MRNTLFYYAACGYIFEGSVIVNTPRRYFAIKDIILCRADYNEYFVQQMQHEGMHVYPFDTE